MKNFTVNIGGQSMTVPGPDDATQEQAQAEGERQWQAKQAAAVQRDRENSPFLTEMAQGGAELVGEPMKAAGYKLGPTYKAGEKRKLRTPQEIAGRITGRVAPLIAMPAGRLFGPAVGAFQGYSTPADTGEQRAANTITGAIGGALPGAALGGQTLDAIAGMAVGAGAGHEFVGGGTAPLWGALIGTTLGHRLGLGKLIESLLARLPPNIAGQILTGSVPIFSPHVQRILQTLGEQSGQQ